MPRGILNKIELESRLYKLKTEYYNGKFQEKSDEWKDGAHYSMNLVLDILNEYSQ